VGRALAVTGILFGQVTISGGVGMISARLGGFRVRPLYLVTGRNLWVSVIAHGTTDTVAFSYSIWEVSGS